MVAIVKQNRYDNKIIKMTKSTSHRKTVLNNLYNNDCPIFSHTKPGAREQLR
jgi:hypothetical protein